MRLSNSLMLTALAAAGWTAEAYLPVTGQDMTYTASKVYAGLPTSIMVPADMFSSDEADSELTITEIIALTDAAGLDEDFLDGSSAVVVRTQTLTAAEPTGNEFHLTSTAVLGGPANLKFNVTAEDPDENRASAILTVPVFARPRPMVTVADNRQVFTSGTLDFNNDKKFTVVATYPEPMTGFAVATNYGLAFAGAAFTTCATVAPSSSNKGRVWTWAVTCTDLTDVDGAGSAGSVNVVNAPATLPIKRVGDNAPSENSNVVGLMYDATNPVVNSYDAANTNAAIRQLKFVAVQGVPFFAPMPPGLFSANPDVTITAGSPSTSLGLRVVPGVNGLAYITGTATAAPVNPASGCGNAGIFFTVTGADKAGNTANAKLCVQILPRSRMNGYTAAFTMNSASTLFTEGDNASSLITSMTWTHSGGANDENAFSALKDAVEGDRMAGSFMLFLDTPDALGADDAFETLEDHKDPETPLALTAILDGSLDRRAAFAVTLGDDETDLATVITLLGRLKYANTKESFTGGARAVRIQLLGSIAEGAGTINNIVMASASRTFTVTNVNDAPTIADGNVTFRTTDYDSGTGTPFVLFEKLDDVADVDDTQMTKAELSIAMSVSGVGVGPCDSTRDLLELPASYAAPKLFGAWDATSCTLTLKPLGGVAAVSNADMVLALKAVVYKNLMNEDPLNGRGLGTDAVALTKRTVSYRVFDAASAGKTTSSAFTVARAGNVTITHDDADPQANRALVYGPSGLFSSTLDFSNLETHEGFQVGVYPVPVTVVDNKAAEASIVEVVFDLSKKSNGVFANGAIFDVDTKDMLSIEAVCEDCLSNGFPMTFTEKVTGTGMYTMTWNVTTGAAVTLGPGNVTVTFTTATGKVLSLPIFVELRARACPFNPPEDNGCTDYEKDETIADYDPDVMYPDGSLCSEASFTTCVDVADTDITTIGRGTVFNVTTFDAIPDIDTFTQDAKIKAAEADRIGARGAFVLAIAPAAISAMASLPLVAVPVSSSLAKLLPAPPKEGSTIDTGASIRLGPACTTFAEPVEICIFVGNTPAATSRTLMLASQKSCTDATQGYKDLEPALDVTFDPISGKLCGKTTHFTVAAPVLVPVVPDAQVDKVFQLGGSCPNDCSGRGYCRQEGKCVCFSGFEGYDCSMRSCPAEQSWDWDSSNAIIHMPVQCSNRGACDGASGICACFDGFEGPACQRVRCPSDCSGNGKCRLLKELPMVQQVGYSSWELERVQVCRCDGGWTGLDCSQRICPYGDDPETICRDTDRQVQRVKLAFGTIPSDVLPTGTDLQRAQAAVRPEDDQFAIVFRSVESSNFSTPRMDSIYRDAATGAMNFEAALKSLPSFAVSDVSVSGVFDATDFSMSYDVTFTGASLQFALTSDANVRSSAAANTVTGKQQLMVCPLNRKSVMGCTAAGCRPLFSQLRMLSQSGGGDISLNGNAILEQPEPTGAGTQATPSVWGVSVTIEVKTLNGNQFFEASSQVYGSTGAVLAAKPLPPAGLRMAVPILYGLTVDMDDANVQDGNGYTFNWRLPSCAVTEQTPASPDYELAECSRRGVCDRKTGACGCFQGYYGYNCGQQTIMF